MIKSEEIREMLSKAFDSRPKDDYGLETSQSDTTYILGKKGESIFIYNIKLRVTNPELGEDIERECKKFGFPIFLPLLITYNKRSLVSDNNQKIKIIRVESKSSKVRFDGFGKEDESQVFNRSIEGKISFRLVKYFFTLYINSPVKDEEFEATIKVFIENYAPNPRERLGKIFDIFSRKYDIFWFFSFQKKGFEKSSIFKFEHPERSRLHESHLSVYSSVNKEWLDDKENWAFFDNNVFGNLSVNEEEEKKIFARFICCYILEWVVLVASIVLYALGLGVIGMIDSGSLIASILSFSIFSGGVLLMIFWTIGFSIIFYHVWQRYLP